MDCDRSDEVCGLDQSELKSMLERSLSDETDLLRTYTILAERIHDNDSLRERLRNFAEGNAKRSKQLMDEIDSLS